MPVLFPDGMTTDPGTLKAAALLESNTDAPPAGAAPDKVTVHDVLELLERPDWLQLTLLITGGPLMTLLIVSVPPAPELDTAVPAGEDATVLLIFTGTLPVAPVARVAVTIATVPFWMIVALANPTSKQVYEPFPPEQVSVLLAAVAAEPAVMITLAILAGL